MMLKRGGLRRQIVEVGDWQVLALLPSLGFPGLRRRFGEGARLLMSANLLLQLY